jgi:hypothetical protein
MKEYFERNLKRQVYEAPQAEVIVIETQGILCASAEDGSRGGTESMNLTNVDWP